jgi:hypothetical protein
MDKEIRKITPIKLNSYERKELEKKAEARKMNRTEYVRWLIRRDDLTSTA